MNIPEVHNNFLPEPLLQLSTLPIIFILSHVAERPPFGPSSTTLLRLIFACGRRTVTDDPVGGSLRESTSSADLWRAFEGGVCNTGPKQDTLLWCRQGHFFYLVKGDGFLMPSITFHYEKNRGS